MNIKEVLELTSDTKVFCVAPGVISDSAKVFAEAFPGKAAVVVADVNTMKIAGFDVEKSLAEAGIKTEKTFVFESPSFHAEYSYVEQLRDYLKTFDAIAIAVGSGAINDVVKLASYELERQYMCVVTVASVDGYTAFGSSITCEGVKKTFYCPAPRALLTDLSMISKAPLRMTAAGYADLAAKIPAGADWILADIAKNEAIDQRAWDIVQDGLGDALSDPEGIKNGDTVALGKLVEGLMLSGFAMQYLKSTRPASGAEHMISMVLNMRNHTHNGMTPAHGFQVAIGTLVTTALYEQLFKMGVDSVNAAECAKNWQSFDDIKKRIEKDLEGTDFIERALEESEAKYSTPEVLEAQINDFLNNWGEISARLKKQIMPFEELKRRFKIVGAPTEPEEIGVSRELLKRTILEARYIRRRYNILDFLERTGMLNAALDGIFGKGGVWEI